MRLKRFKKCFVVLMCLTMVLSIIGCGKNTSSSPSSTSSSSQASVSSQASQKKEEKEKKPSISDFYEYACGDWISNHSLTESEYNYATRDDHVDIVDERTEAIFVNNELLQFPEESGLNKLNVYFNQLNDAENASESLLEIRKMTDRIQAVNSIKALSDLMAEEDYSLFNNLVFFSYELNASGNYLPSMGIKNLMDLYGILKDEYYEAMLDGYSKQLVVLGYSEEEAGKIASLAMDFYKELKIYETTAPIEGLLWYSDEKLAEIKCPIDLYSIMYNNGYCALTKINWEEPGMFIEPTYIDWLMQNITEENLEKIKAFYVICLLDSTFLYGTDDYLNAYDTIFSELIKVKKMPELLENRRAMAGVLNDESGILADYYAGKYITQAQIDETKAIIDELKAAYLEIIGNVEWLDASQKEILNIRLKKINFQLGKVDNFNLLEDFEIKENGFLTHLALRKSNRLFSQQIRKEGVRMLDITGFPLFDENAFYERKENAVIVGNAFFADEDWWNNSTYEEKIGYFGNTLSHEIGHFLDGSNFGLKANGVYQEIFDTASEDYMRSGNAVYFFYNEKETDNGLINGAMVYNESIADLLGMKASLLALSKHESVDYEKFFETFASFYAEISTPEYSKFSMEFDTHLPSKERVNYCLSHFDKFYETFDVSKKSPYFTDKEDRIDFLK